MWSSTSQRAAGRSNGSTGREAARAPGALALPLPGRRSSRALQGWSELGRRGRRRPLHPSPPGQRRSRLPRRLASTPTTRPPTATTHPRCCHRRATCTGRRRDPDADSWLSPAPVRDRGVAAEAGAGAAETGVARTLTAAEQRSVASLQRQVAAHTEKLEAYRANPDAFDNLGYLERAPSPEIRQRIIDGRINHLETEIRGFQDQIDKLLGGG